MAVEGPVQQRTDRTSTEDRSASLSAYVDLPIAEVAARFSHPAIDDVLTSAIRAARVVDADAALEAHAAPSIWVSAGNVRVVVEWRAQGPAGPATEGAATVSLLVVQSGHDAITELLVSLPVSGESAGVATEAAHRILDELTRLIEGFDPAAGTG